MRRLAVLLALLLAGGCSLFKDDEAIDPPAELQDFEPTLKVERLWRTKVGGGRGSALVFWRSRPGRKPEVLRLGLAPASDGGRVYAGAYDGRVVAHDVVDGKRYWAVKTDLKLSAGPAVGEGVAVLGSIDGQLIALNTLDGAERWRIDVDGEVLSAPAIAPGLVVVRTVDGHLRGLRLDDGAELWSVNQSVPLLSLRGTASPVIVGATVLCGFDNGKLSAFDLATGEQLWEYTVEEPRGRTALERLADVDTAVVVRGNDVYAAGYQGRLVALALDSATPQWAREISSHAGIAVAPTSVYVTDSVSDVHALRRRDGVPLWSQTALHQRALTSPVMHQRYLVVGDFEGYLHWLDPNDGTLVGRTRHSDDPVAAQPLVVGDTLFVQGERGVLRAYTLKTGE